MTHWDSQRFVQSGRESGVAETILQNAVASANYVFATNNALPPVLSLRHLADEVGVSYEFLREVVSRAYIDEPYRVFKLSKKNVGHAPDRFRFICVPHPQLLKTQRWIHEKILSLLPVSHASKAYAPGSRVFDAAQMHVSCKWLIKLDITNFFEAILETDVYSIFRKAGYQPLIAFELSRICTRLRASGNPIANRLTTKNFESDFPYSSGFIGHLPQGAPTSPLLANLSSLNLDATLIQLAMNNGFVYSRYADDLVFSTKRPFDRVEAWLLVKEVYNVIRANGLWPNRTKTRIVPPGARKVVLGLLVDGASPRLTNEFKDRLRTHLHFLLRVDFGPARHAKERGFDSVYGMQRHVYGLVAYAIGIEPVWARPIFEKLAKVDWPKFEGF
jgi:RNA-directed DNA polymerase